ncbi:MAG TPA: hypothetical protein VFX92_14240 [Candidatus Krumholzibacteria bacterium]|nr:hypothetical protein [Candidatus Krumholzibacteria bacterium]
MLRRRAGTIAAQLLRDAPAGAITGIFAGGSVARGEVWAAEVAGVHEIYSDIDLYVLVADGASLEAVRRVMRAATALPADDGGNVRFVRSVDAGVYTPADLRAQPMRPGTVDLRARRLVLAGDPAAIDACLPAPLPPAAEEALYLLENRAWDALAAPPSTDTGRRAWKVFAYKVDLDIAAAHLIASGAGAEAVADPVTALAGSAGEHVPPDVAGRARVAAAARAQLNAALANDDVIARPPLERLCAAWQRLAPGILGAAAGADLIAIRCAAGRRFRNLREFVRVASSRGMPRGVAVAGAVPRISRASRSVLRVHALVRGLERAQLVDDAALRAHLAQVEAVTRLLGFGGGALDERARVAHDAIS